MAFEPLISVLMPVYNGASFLREAIESILNQTFTNFEFIIINDGSTDDSVSIISEYENKDPRVRLINQRQNSGLIDVLNLGLSIAKGEYIARMDADDISLPNRFATQARFLDVHPDIGVVGSNVHFIDSVGRKTSNFINNPRLPQTSNQIKWSLCFSCCLMHPTIMARRELLLNAGGYNKLAKHAEDYDLWVRLAPITNFYNLPQKLLLLRRHETNITVVYIETTRQNSNKISQQYITSIIGSNFAGEMTSVMGKEILFQLVPIDQIITLFDILFIAFNQKNTLNFSDIRFIKEDIGSRLLERGIQEKIPLKTRKKIYLYAIGKTPFCFWKTGFRIFVRKIWKKIKSHLKE